MAARRRLFTELITTLRLDLSDPDSNLFDDATLQRCIRKAAFQVGRDLEISIQMWRTRFRTLLEDEVYDLILILAGAYGCQVMRAATATNFIFASGDKRVDKSKQPEHWAMLETDLLDSYRKYLGQLRPEAEVNEEAYIITPAGLAPVIYEQGGDV